MAARMRFTTFKSVKDTTPVTYEGWEQFAEALQKIKVTPTKSDVPLYCAAEYIAPRRVMENVLHVSFGIIDVDSFGEDEVAQACKEIESLGVGYIIHTTHSHHQGLANGKFKCRLIIPFDRPVLPEEWDRVWHGLNDIVGGIADKQCKNPNAIYYFPSCPPGEAENTAFVSEIDGAPLPIDLLLEEAEPIDRKDSFIPEVDEAVLKRIESSVRYQLAAMFLEKFPAAIQGKHGDSTTLRAAMVGGDFGLTAEQFWPLLLNYNERCKPKWKQKDLRQKLKNAEKYRGLPIGWRLVNRSEGDVVSAKHVKEHVKKIINKEGHLGVIGRHLERMLKGDPIGAEAVAVFESVAQNLAYKYPTADPVALALVLEKSIEATKKANHKDVTVEIVAERISDAQQKIQAQRAEDQLEREMLQRLANKDAFATVGVERSTGYSDREIEAFAKEAGLDVREFCKRWIVQFDKSYYFFIGGKYTRRPYKDSEASNMVKTALAPARLTMHRIGQNGLAVPMGLGELMAHYGSVAHEVVVDLSAQDSRYDSKTQVFTEAPCPFRPLKAERCPWFEEWIHLMAGDMEDKMLDWTACIPLLSRPIAALYLYGFPRSGKSLYANGAARLWLSPDQGGPVKLESIAGNFNDNIRKSPLIFGDEDVPRDNSTGEPRTAYMRELVQAVSHDYKRKHIGNSTIKGCLRIIIAANDADLIVNKRQALTNNSISAINERFLCIPIRNDKAQKFLDDLKTKPGADEFFGGDAIPKHIWWLHENRKVQHDTRFLVAGLPGSELEMRMMTGAGLRSEVCHWITAYLMAPESKRNAGPQGDRPLFDKSRHGEMRMLVTPKMLHSLWNVFLGQAVPKPAIGAIEKALGGVTESKRVKLGGDNYRQVVLRRVKYWALVNGECTSQEKFDEFIGQHGLTCGDVDIVEGVTEDDDA